jgi:pimeloyl-ACP methyl ester carboxylesterase
MRIKIKDIIGKNGGILKVAIIVLLILVIGFAAALIKVNSMVGEQLRLTLAPEYLESTAIGTGSKSFEIDIKLYNKFVCEASCNYTLTDISHNIVIDRGTFGSKAFKNEHYSRELPLNYNGYGTNLYLYRLECVNNYTTLCPANRDAIIRKSLLVLSYEPSSEQLSALSYLNKNYPTISANFVNSSKKFAISGKIIDLVNLSFDMQEYRALEKNLKDINDDINAMLGVWINDDYVSAMSLADGADMVERSRSVLSESENYNIYLYQTIDNHNRILGDITQNYYILGVYKDILSISSDLSGLNASESASILNFILRSNSLINTLNTETYSYGLLYNDAVELGGAIPELNNVIFNRTKQGIVDSYAPVFVYSKIMCIMNNNSGLCSVNATNSITGYISGNEIINNASNNVSYDNISRIPNRFRELCSAVSDVDSEIGKSTQSSGGNSSNNASLNTLLLEYKLLLDYELLLGNSKGLSKRLLSYKSLIRESLRKDYNITNLDVELSKHQFTGSALVLNPGSPLLLDIDAMIKDCNSGSDIALPSLNIITSTYRTIPQFEDPYVKVPKAPVTIPKCCIYNICQSCSINNTGNPLILLHGHSFNQGVDAYRSIEIFDGFEYSLSGENLYFLTGLLVNGGNASAGVLGRYAIPMISKPTYYIETYNDLLGLNVRVSKDVTIDTYALRLKESIDRTLYLTGNDKVDIVAHSMGGLVVRRYMQIFGTKNVGTVILVGTPNNGINDVTYSLCKIFGASAECEDMRSDSIFMGKLNDPSNQPDMSNMYLVVGRGCDTEGVDGDGVVTVDSAVIKNFPEKHILFIDRNGEECSATKIFHQDLLDAYKYPEVYSFIKSKLGVG